MAARVDTSALEGEHVIEARAYDLAGNPSTPVSIRVFAEDKPKSSGGCGCASSSPRDGGWLLLALFAFRRRPVRAFTAGEASTRDEPQNGAWLLLALLALLALRRRRRSARIHCG